MRHLSAAAGTSATRKDEPWVRLKSKMCCDADGGRVSPGDLPVLVIYRSTTSLHAVVT